jgi:hypothetical protein
MILAPCSCRTALANDSKQVYIKLTRKIYGGLYIIRYQNSLNLWIDRNNVDWYNTIDNADCSENQAVHIRFEHKVGNSYSTTQANGMALCTVLCIWWFIFWVASA